MAIDQIQYNLFVHNVFGDFARSVAAFLSNDLYEDMTYVIMGTYEKAIEHFSNIQRTGESKVTIHKYPFMLLDPRLDFEPDVPAGQFYQNYPNYASSTSVPRKTYGPDLYNDGVVQVAPIINRYRGSFEVVIWCRSVYEYIDLRFLTYQYFGGGIGREIYPINFEGGFILDDTIYFYEYKNRYNRRYSYKLNWENYRVEKRLIRSINREKWVYPYSIRPRLKLTAVNDASSKYGGDNLAEYKLMLDIEWESYIPTHLIVSTRDTSLCAEDCRIDLFVESALLNFPEINQNINVSDRVQIVCCGGDDEGSDGKHPSSYDIRFKEYLIYNLTEQDLNCIESDEEFVITLPDPVEYNRYLVLQSIYGELVPGYDYCLDLLNKNKINVSLAINKGRGPFKVNDCIVIAIFEEEKYI